MCKWRTVWAQERRACVCITMPFAIRRVTNYSSTYVRSRSSIWPPPNRLYLHSYVFTCAKARIEPSRNTHSNMALKPRMITQARICTDKHIQHTHTPINYIFDTTSFPHLTLYVRHHHLGWSPLCYIYIEIKNKHVTVCCCRCGCMRATQLVSRAHAGESGRCAVLFEYINIYTHKQ